MICFHAWLACFQSTLRTCTPSPSPSRSHRWKTQTKCYCCWKKKTQKVTSFLRFSQIRHVCSDFQMEKKKNAHTLNTTPVPGMCVAHCEPHKDVIYSGQWSCYTWSPINIIPFSWRWLASLQSFSWRMDAVPYFKAGHMRAACIGIVRVPLKWNW